MNQEYYRAQLSNIPDWTKRESAISYYFSTCYAFYFLNYSSPVSSPQKTLVQLSCSPFRNTKKTEVIRKESKPNFPKSKHFLPPDTHTYLCISGVRKCSSFGKFRVFSCYSVLRSTLLRHQRQKDVVDVPRQVLRYCKLMRKIGSSYEQLLQ